MKAREIFQRMGVAFAFTLCVGLVTVATASDQVTGWTKVFLIGLPILVSLGLGAILAIVVFVQRLHEIRARRNTTLRLHH